MKDAIWARINANAGEVFYLKKGKPFTYQVDQVHIKHLFIKVNLKKHWK